MPFLKCPKCSMVLKCPESSMGQDAVCSRCYTRFSANDHETSAPIQRSEPDRNSRDSGRNDNDRNQDDRDEPRDRDDRSDRASSSGDRRQRDDGDKRRRYEANRRDYLPTRRRRDPSMAFPWGKVVVIGVACIIACVILVIAINALTSNSGPSGIPKDKWKLFDAEGLYKVRFPGKPKQQSVEVSGNRLVCNQIDYDSETKFAVFNTERTFNEEPEKILTPFSNEMAVVLPKGAVETQREFTWLQQRSFPGQQVVYKSQGSQLRIVVRVCNAHGRLYYLMVMGRGYGADHPDVKHFLNSFEVTGR